MNKLNIETLIIGASGFVGHALLRNLEKMQIPVRCLLRNPKKVSTTASTTELVQGDLMEPETVRAALNNIKTIYYLAHALDEKSSDFEKIEKLQAEGLAQLTEKGQRVIYLSGLGHGDLSPHLRSRQNVGKYLAQGAAQVIELRASIIIGEGSLSFELIRALVNRLPFIISTSWSKVAAQPLALSDLLECLQQSKMLKVNQHHLVIEIGGRDQVFYEDLLRIYAKIEGLSRPTLELPQLSKKMARDSLKMVAPEFFQVGAKLLGSIEIPSVIQAPGMEVHFQFRPKGIEEAMKVCSSPYSLITEEEQYLMLKSLGDNKQFAQFLKGNEFIEVFDLPVTWDVPLDLAFLVDKMRAPLKLIPGAAKLSGWDLSLDKERISAHFHFLLTGNFRLELFHPNDRPEILRVVIGFRPKFFYENAQWLIYSKITKVILGQLERLLNFKR